MSSSPYPCDFCSDIEIWPKLDQLDHPWRLLLEFLERLVSSGSGVSGRHLFISWKDVMYLRTGENNRILTILTEPQDLALLNFCIFLDFLMMWVNESTNSFSWGLIKLGACRLYPKHFNFYLTERLRKSTKVSQLTAVYTILNKQFF